MGKHYFIVIFWKEFILKIDTSGSHTFTATTLIIYSFIIIYIKLQIHGIIAYIKSLMNSPSTNKIRDASRDYWLLLIGKVLLLGIWPIYCLIRSLPVTQKYVSKYNFHIIIHNLHKIRKLY